MGGFGSGRPGGWTSGWQWSQDGEQVAKLFGARLKSVKELTQGARLDGQVIQQLAEREPMSAVSAKNYATSCLADR